MKTLILNGSPRANGDTAFMIKTLTAKLQGEVTVIDCYKANISPCVDCRACKVKPDCVIKDDMQNIYSALCECDNVVLASPVHYGELSAMLLKVASRFQVYSSAILFRREKPDIKANCGAVILSQGGSGGAQRAYETAGLIFQSLGIKRVLPLVCSINTDKLPAEEDEKAINELTRLADTLNKKPDRF